MEELRDFHRFLTDKLSAHDLSPEEALDEWRRLHPQTHMFDENVAAIQEVREPAAVALPGEGQVADDPVAIRLQHDAFDATAQFGWYGFKKRRYLSDTHHHLPSE